MDEITLPTFTASFTLGLKQGYHEEQWTPEEVIRVLQEEQVAMERSTNVLLSARVTPCRIVCKGQDEPSLELSFIQYPRFPLEEEVLRQAILSLARRMMDRLSQNRTVVVFPDVTVMLEGSQAVDPGITGQP